MKLTILAFLPNPWFPEGTSRGIVEQYQTDQEFHRDLLKCTMAGIQLHQAFGEEMWKRIIWENVSPVVTDHPRKKAAKNQGHVDAIISKHKPDLILAFGEQAHQAVSDSVGAIRTKVMVCHHPGSRVHYQADLDTFAQHVWDYVLVTERDDEFTKEDSDES